jgi:SAM-dependent methyltransferase
VREGLPPGGVVRDDKLPYADHVLFEVLFRKHLPRRPGLRVLEIGSAPGTVLVRLARMHGWEPWGVEYAASGAEANRKVFVANGFDPAHVLEGDFFSAQFQDEHRASFDIVFSRGFIEHFTDVSHVIAKHAAIVKPGGHLAVTIPRFRGVYWPWMRLFDAADLARHNLEIMRIEAFRRAFEHQGLTTLHCGYYGTLALRRFTLPGDHPLARAQRKLMTKGAAVVELASRWVLGDAGVANSLLSPYLVWIGTKAA